MLPDSLAPLGRVWSIATGLDKALPLADFALSPLSVFGYAPAHRRLKRKKTR
jgi:hypothetical protein